MPLFITIPDPQPYPPVTIPMLAPGVEGYMFGYRNDYRYGVGVIIPDFLVQGHLSLEFALPSYAGVANNSPTIQWVVQYPSPGSPPSNVEVHLEGTLDLLNGPWFQLAKSTNVAGDSITVNLGSSRVLAVRTNVVSAVESGSPPTASIISTVMI